MSLTEADKFVSGCTLGQTEQGSYVLTVGAFLEVGHDLTKTPDDPEHVPDPPFGRKTSQYLLRAVDILATAIRKDEYEAIFEPKGDQLIISSNLCDALVDILPSDEGADLRLRSSWSPLFPIPNVRSEVFVDRNMFEPLEKVGSQLKPKADSKSATFLGFVVELKGEPGPTLEVQGEVTMALHTPDDEDSVRVRVILGHEDYRKAVDAHLYSRAIHIKGLLRRGGRVNRLDEPSEFKTF